MITKLVMASAETIVPASPHVTEQTVLKVLLAMSFSHLLNDTIQSLLPAIYPLLKENYHLTFAQVGLITLTFQATASLLQPVVGSYTDRRPKPYSLAVGMGFTLIGLILLSRATDYRMILVSAALVGMGSSIFHPEASRIAHMAAGGRHGFAQSLFQVGGNLGSSLGPLAGLIIVARGQTSILWFSAIAALGHLYSHPGRRLVSAQSRRPPRPRQGPAAGRGQAWCRAARSSFPSASCSC
jgi:FSR family fosmidomycin resistance protein-like MFS transporter